MSFLRDKLENEALYMEMEELKGIYKKAFMKAKEISNSPKQQKVLIEKLADDIVMENIEMIRREEPNISDEKRLKAISALRNLISKWNKEFNNEEQ